jgi:hypothetical protein
MSVTVSMIADQITHRTITRLHRTVLTPRGTSSLQSGAHRISHHCVQLSNLRKAGSTTEPEVLGKLLTGSVGRVDASLSM